MKHKVMPSTLSKSELEPPCKKIKVELESNAVNSKFIPGSLLNVGGDEVVLQGGWLTDVHIEFAQ